MDTMINSGVDPETGLSVVVTGGRSLVTGEAFTLQQLEGIAQQFTIGPKDGIGYGLRMGFTSQEFEGMAKLIKKFGVP